MYVHALSLVLYSIAWTVLIYCINVLIARRAVRLNPSKALLYITTMAALGVLGEIVFDTVYTVIFGRPLWLYRLLPIHHGYTSLYSLFLWGTVGLYIYMLHGTLKRSHITSALALACIFCLDAVLFEIFANLSYIAIFKNYIFYYLPGDLWHLTSLQAVPIYLFAGLVTVYTFDFAKSRQRSATIGSTIVATCIVAGSILLIK